MKKINYIKISLASSKKITSWSSGEVKNSETMNYRTFKPEVDGLFCQRIFGTVRKNSCNCSRYREYNISNGVCIGCGVDVLDLTKRRTSMGYIKLISPIVHIWFFKSIPSKLSLILNMSLKNLEKIIYYYKYIVTDSEIPKIKERTLLEEKEYHSISLEYGNKVSIRIGADAIKRLLKKIDFKKEYDFMKKLLKTKLINSYPNPDKVIDRFEIFKSIIKKKNKIKNIITKVIPVLPPDLRPIVKLDNEKYASSDLNELYRRVLNRNNRLKKLYNIGAPDFIVRNEKKMLQESVDCLFDNGRKERFLNSRNMPLKSLSDNIKGKKGRFRNNLLGKRVDFSARSVIVVEPNMKINQCGIPAEIALELFKPFLYEYLVRKKYYLTINIAKEKVKEKSDLIMYCLNKIIHKRPIILNRAPTLHRLGVQAFYPYLVNDYAIHIHPLVCSAFNADFDGDQMAVHVPLTYESLTETKKILISSKNIFSPSNGEINIMPSQEILLGLYLMTKRDFKYNYIKTKIFSNFNQIDNHFFIYNNINENVFFKIKKGVFINSTIGRIFIYKILPCKSIFYKFNRTLLKSDVYEIINLVYKKTKSKKKLRKFIYDLTEIGFKYSTLSGISLSLTDFKLVKNKKKYINYFLKIYKYHGLRKSINKWNGYFSKLNKIMFRKISYDKFIFNKKKINFKGFNTVFSILCSGSKGTNSQLFQLNVMRGLMMNSIGKLINFPMYLNLREGLNVFQYFISTYGARKGLSDTSLKTANSGYLTRRLVDVAQDFVINKIDCKTKNYLNVLFDRNNFFDFFGKYLFDNVYNYDGKLIIKKNSVLNNNSFKILKDNGIFFLRIRSSIYCKSKNSCSYCYGYDLSKKQIVNLGTAVGIIAAQSIGEPGTQLTMRTFHTGGASFFIFNKYIKKINFLCYLSFKKETNFFIYNYRIFFLNNFKCYLLNLDGKLLCNVKLNAGDYFDFQYYLTNRINIKKTLSDNKYFPFFFVFEKIEFYNFAFKKNFIFFKSNDSFNFKLFNIKKKVFVKTLFMNKINWFFFDKKTHIVYNILNKYYKSFKIKKFKYKLELKNITDSLKIISNLFESRKPKTKGFLSNFGGVLKIKRSNYFMKENCISVFKKRYHIKRIDFKSDSSYFLKGERMNLGDLNLNSVISIIGIGNFFLYLSKKIQKIYNDYGININKKHFEIIIKKMISKVLIQNRKKSHFYNKEKVNRNIMINYNLSHISKCIYKNIVLGITKISLLSDSYISSASFQETTRILVNSSLICRKDYLLGLKENVMVGKLIPAGVGFFYYKIIKNHVNN
ncbi:DNA-directed RNA polymerase subunit beta' [Candidatus Vidania fulgoroideorum]